MALTKVTQLLDPRRHFDHKAAGVVYVTAFVVQTYLILAHLNYYEAGFLPHVLAPFIGIFVCLTALRNFKFLSRSKENPGMFAHKRTFSRSFVIENLWFQFVGVTVMLMLHPPCRRLLTPWGCVALFAALYYSRELFPKTSYVSWEKGNKEINKMKGKDSWSVWFINLQVKLVRLNFVFKKYYGIYLVLCATMEAGKDLLGLPLGTMLPDTDRVVAYMVALDAMHNVTTAFFLQTLKFKGFISAEVFSVLFNTTPMIGFVFTAWLALTQHQHVWPLFLAMATDMSVNLYLIYPSSLPTEWKNRISTTVKVGGLLVAYKVCQAQLAA